MSSPDLDTRYGRTPAQRARRRFVEISVAVGTGVLLVGWLIWAGLMGPMAAIETKDVGYVATSDDSALVRWQLTAPVDTAVSCAVKALSEKHTVVGWRVIDLPPSSESTRILRASLRTSEPITSGGVHRCWLTSEASGSGAVAVDLP